MMKYVNYINVLLDDSSSIFCIEVLERSCLCLQCVIGLVVLHLINNLLNMSTMMCTYYLGGKILVKALSNQRGLGKELVELVRRLYLQHLLSLVLLQDHNGAINLDLELLQDAQSLLFGFL